MDALSAVLSTVRMTGAITFNAEFTAPWGFAAPSAQELAPVLAPGTEQLVIYHLLTDGRALARAEGMEELPLAAGDIVVMPHGERHTVSNGSPRTLMDNTIPIKKYLSGDLSTTYYGGGGEATRFVCGYLVCERHACRSFLSGLPSLFKINIVATQPASGWNIRSDIWSRRRLRSAPEERLCFRRWLKRSSSRRCAATWISCPPGRPAGLPRRREIQSSATRSSCCTANLATLGLWPTWLLRLERHAPSLSNGSLIISANPR
jgi:hypothetical protein